MNKNIISPDVNINCFTSHMGLYAMEINCLQQSLYHVQNSDFQVLSAEQVDKQTGAYLQYNIVHKVAIVPIVGSITKRPSKYGGTSSLNARRVIRDAIENKGVSSLMLYVDSPGGQSNGIADLAAEIRSARLTKPVYAYIEDLGASAAYWAASQADKVFINKGGEAGSIGTYMFLYDYSEKYSKEGIKPILIATGDYKGLGAPGTEVTKEQVAYLSELVERTNSQFLSAVSESRSIAMDSLKKIANGKIYSSDESLTYGLVDGIASYDEVFNMLANIKDDRDNNDKEYNRPMRSEIAQMELDMLL